MSPLNVRELHPLHLAACITSASTEDELWRILGEVLAPEVVDAILGHTSESEDELREALEEEERRVERLQKLLDEAREKIDEQKEYIASVERYARQTNN